MVDLVFLLGLRRANQFEIMHLVLLTSLRQERVDANERVGAVVLLAFIVKAFFLNLAALVHRVHCAKHATAFGYPLELLIDGLFDQVCELVYDKRALPRVFAIVQAEFFGNDHLNGNGPAHRLLRRRCDRFVKSVRVQAVAVVEQGIQSLQGCANVVEAYFLCMQAAARSLYVILEHLAAGGRAVTFTHGSGPDAPRHAADHRIFRVHAVGEEEAQVRREVINIHTAREVVLDDRKTIRQGECQLTYRVRARFGNVITTYRDAVIIAHSVVDKELLDITHHLHRKLGRENAGILRLVLLENIGLHRATNCCKRLLPDFFVDFRGNEPVTGDAEQAESQSITTRGQLADVFRSQLAFEIRIDFLSRRFPLVVFFQMFFHLLIDRCVHEKRENHRCGSVDRHRDRCRRITKVEAGIQFLHVIDRSDGNAGVADLAVDIGPLVRVLAVQRNGIECRGQPGRVLAFRQIMKTAIGSLRRALAGEHPGRVLAKPAVRVYTACIRIGARQVFSHQEAQQFSPVAKFGRRDLGNLLMTETFLVIGPGYFLAAYLVAISVIPDTFPPRRPLPQQLQGLGADVPDAFLVTLAQYED